jgi:DNA mismatch endonuclease, patch repair protein
MKRTKAEVSAVMQRIHSKGTTPELRLSTALRRLKLRFSLHRSDLPGCPDFVFERQRVVVFVDGDFWHGRQWKLRGLSSLASQFERCRNRKYWIAKIERNISRDTSTSRRLRCLGWRVLRIWESDLRQRPEISVKRVIRALERNQ